MLKSIIGVKAGVNLAKADFSNEDYSTSALIGVHGGVYANYKFAKALAAQLEILYSTEGTKETHIPSGMDFTLNASFIQIPVLLQYLTTAGLTIETGPQFGLVLSMKEKANNGSMSQDIKALYKTMDLRWALGLGYQLAAVNGLGIHARYSMSLSALNEQNISGSSLKNRVFYFGLSYALLSNLKK